MAGSSSHSSVAPQIGTTRNTPLTEESHGGENEKEEENNQQKNHFIMAGIRTHMVPSPSHVEIDQVAKFRYG